MYTLELRRRDMHLTLSRHRGHNRVSLNCAHDLSDINIGAGNKWYTFLIDCS
jgi:hypothetical protein